MPVREVLLTQYYNYRHDILIANIGDALDIGVIWDGFDIVKALSRIVSY